MRRNLSGQAIRFAAALATTLSLVATLPQSAPEATAQGVLPTYPVCVEPRPVDVKPGVPWRCRMSGRLVEIRYAENGVIIGGDAICTISMNPQQCTHDGGQSWCTTMPGSPAGDMTYEPKEDCTPSKGR